MSSYDLVVVGGGLAGLITALSAQSKGMKVTVVARGEGSILLSSGCVDLLGYVPGDSLSPVLDPLEGIRKLALENPEHPYVKAGEEMIEEAVAFLLEQLSGAGLAYCGDIRRNRWIPTASGNYRITALVPWGMSAGAMPHDNGSGIPGKTLIAGLRGYRNFSPELVAAGLAHSAPGQEYRSGWIDLESEFHGGFRAPVGLARLLDRQEVMSRFISALETVHQGEELIGLPAVLGFHDPEGCRRALEEGLKAKVFEIPCLPPSVPGCRLADGLKQRIQLQGGYVEQGFPVVDFESRGNQLLCLRTEYKEYRAPAFVLAMGTLFGKGLVADRADIKEPLLDLPLSIPFQQEKGVSTCFLDPQGHPVGSVGVETDNRFRPRDNNGGRSFDNVWITGDLLAHHNPYRDKSGAGVALVSGYLAGLSAAGAL